MKRTTEATPLGPLLLAALFLLVSCAGVPKGDYSAAELEGRRLVPADPRAIEQVFVPGGAATLGSDAAEKALGYAIGGAGARKWRWFDSEARRTVEVEDFYIDRYPVTQAQYYIFVKETGHRRPFISEADYERQGFLVHPYASVRPYLWSDEGQPPAGKLDDPVVLVSLDDAREYCRWRDRFHPGRTFRPPTEDEWEKAARGADGRYFPWGYRWDDNRANIGRSGPQGTTPVTRYDSGQSPYGAYDMAGNVFEWTSTGAGPGTGRRILKSCSWDDMPGICRGAARHGRPGASRHILIGFRCVSVPDGD
ncbi:MAG: formylglycine-generating enzyme family protein [Thermodesulfobacteriota bacterium]